MLAKVITLRTTASGMQAVEALSDNDLLFVFAAPAGAFRVGESIGIDPGLIGRPQTIASPTGASAHSVVIHPHDVHDLRIPASHGTSRFPSQERLGGG